MGAADLKTIRELFEQTSATKRREVLLKLCENSLIVWELAASKLETTHYTESVCGSTQKIDLQLPRDAFVSIKHGGDIEDITKRYSEPIAALHDDDLAFADEVEFAYYCIYNAFKRYGAGKEVSELLILNQALSSLPSSELDAAIEGVWLALI